MGNREIPALDYIARFCKPRVLTEEGEPTGEAFRLRSNEEALSVNWLELLNEDLHEAVQGLREVFKAKFDRVPTKAKFAISNVGETLDFVEDETGRLLRVLHEPKEKDNSHSGIHNLPANEEDAMLVGALIAEKVIETYTAKT